MTIDGSCATGRWYYFPKVAIPFAGGVGGGDRAVLVFRSRGGMVAPRVAQTNRTFHVCSFVSAHSSRSSFSGGCRRKIAVSGAMSACC